MRSGIIEVVGERIGLQGDLRRRDLGRRSLAQDGRKADASCLGQNGELERLGRRRHGDIHPLPGPDLDGSFGDGRGPGRMTVMGDDARFLGIEDQAKRFPTARMKNTKAQRLRGRRLKHGA
jgi:hypothetical protein